MKPPNRSFQRTVKKLRFLPSAEFARYAAEVGSLLCELQNVATMRDGVHLARTEACE